MWNSFIIHFSAGVSLHGFMGAVLDNLMVIYFSKKLAVSYHKSFWEAVSRPVTFLTFLARLSLKNWKNNFVRETISVMDVTILLLMLIKLQEKHLESLELSFTCVQKKKEA